MSNNTKPLPIPGETADAIALKLEKAVDTCRVISLAIVGANFDGSTEIRNLLVSRVENTLYSLVCDLREEANGPGLIEVVSTERAEEAHV